MRQGTVLNSVRIWFVIRTGKVFNRFIANTYAQGVCNMAISQVIAVPRTPNFAVPRSVTKCLNCGREIFSGNDMYSKRFCNVRCKQEYLL